MKNETLLELFYKLMSLLVNKHQKLHLADSAHTYVTCIVVTEIDDTGNF